mmetsp:Transcript_6201/g.25726  ORF Transcript_6201/g.25726 Transcript_6201/m.25726 type:complete len:341 (+) Transcript_6201:880-1902(+)
MVSSTIRRARMTLPRGPDTSHWPVPLATFALAPLCRSISLMVAPPRPMTRPSWPGHGTSMATCSSMSSPLSTSGKSAADASSPESIFARADARSLAIIVPGVSTATPKPAPGIEPATARSPLLMSPRSITSEMSAAASRMTASAPVTTHVPRSLRISIFTANLRSMCFTVSPPLPMTRPSLPLTLISTDALPVLGSIVIGGMSNDGAVWAAAAGADAAADSSLFGAFERPLPASSGSAFASAVFSSSPLASPPSPPRLRFFFSMESETAFASGGSEWAGDAASSSSSSSSSRIADGPAAFVGSCGSGSALATLPSAAFVDTPSSSSAWRISSVSANVTSR